MMYTYCYFIILHRQIEVMLNWFICLQFPARVCYNCFGFCNGDSLAKIFPMILLEISKELIVYLGNIRRRVTGLLMINIPSCCFFLKVVFVREISLN